MDAVRRAIVSKFVNLNASLGPNAHLVGQPDGRLRLNTPALILDLDILERNILLMSKHGQDHDLAIRPHVKCHKSAQIAALQRAAGAMSFCCATIGEAEMMAAAGFTSILVTSPLVGEDKIGRAIALTQLDAQLCLVVDNPANAAQLSDLCALAGVSIDVLVDVDPGMHRTGVASQIAAIELVGYVRSLPSLGYQGLQCYAGHVQHIEDAEARQEASLAVMGALRVLCEELKALDWAPAVISGGGTGTYLIDAQAAVLTELQAGSYVVMDNQYNNVWAANALPPPFDVALFVQSAVISANHPGHVTCDAGFKHFAVDGGRPVVARGASLASEYEYFGDVHGLVRTPPGQPQPGLGARIEFVVPHCDPTINLYDQYHCVRGDQLVAIWPVDARGV